MSENNLVVLKDIPVVCVKSNNGITGSKKAFDKLEFKLGLKGRKFYGVVVDLEREYLACATLKENETPENYEFERYVVPSGRYAKEKIIDWPKKLKIIGETFQRMTKKHKRDMRRPLIEFYKSQKELILFLPIEN